MVTLVSFLILVTSSHSVGEYDKTTYSVIVWLAKQFGWLL